MAGVVARPTSTACAPADTSPASTAGPSRGAETRGSLPTATWQTQQHETQETKKAQDVGARLLQAGQLPCAGKAVQAGRLPHSMESLGRASGAKKSHKHQHRHPRKHTLTSVTPLCLRKSTKLCAIKNTAAGVRVTPSSGLAADGGHGECVRGSGVCAQPMHAV
jgi:hypothetical protein